MGKLKIVIVSDFFSEGMGYSENILPKILASMGHEVHVLTSALNIYGNTEDYNTNYKSFLGDAENKTGSIEMNGFILHRLPYKKVSNYVLIRGLINKIHELSPDVVQTISVNSINTFLVAAIKPLYKFSLFTECHQHLSVVKPYLITNNNSYLKKMWHKLTRKFPIFISSMFIKRCYAIAPDCFEVANKIYGFPLSKIALQPLGTDTGHFKPALTKKELKERIALKGSLGIIDKKILCIYTGRFSERKNPALLAQAIDELSQDGFPYFGLFIGSGPQKQQIEECSSAIVLPFMKYIELVKYYQIADIGVWPNEESLSMFDAASCGLPIVVNNKIGEKERVTGNGYMFKKNDVCDLKTVLLELQDREKREILGAHGRKKVLQNYNWYNIASERVIDYKSL